MCATFCSAGMMRPRMPAISFSRPWMIAACARAMPRSNSASCWAEICMGCLLATDGSIAAMFSWKRPGNLGVQDGRLAPCKRTPNCVSSQADPADAEHCIAPIPFDGTMVEAMVAAMRAVESMERSKIVLEEHGYIYAEFLSRLLRFVDAVELLYDHTASVFHVRSASRLGRRDFGVNRKRIELLRSRLRSKAS